LFNPDFYGNPGDGSYVIGGAYFETAGYIGILPMVLAMLTLLRLRKTLVNAEPMRRSRMLFFVLVAVITLILAFGNQTPIYPLLYRYVPTFNLFQAPARWLLLTMFALTMLAAETASTWETTYRIKRNLRLTIAVAVGLAILGAVMAVALPNATDIMRQMTRGIGVLGVLIGLAAVMLLVQPAKDSPRRAWWQIAVLVFVAGDLVWANRVSNPTIAPSFYAEQCPREAVQGRIYVDKDAEQATLEAALPFKDYPYAVAHADEFRCSGLPNLNLLDDVPYFNNFDPLRPAWFETITEMLGQSAAVRQAAQVGRIVGGDAAPSETELLRAWIAPRAVIATSTEDAQAKMLAPDWNPRETVILMDDADLSLLTAAGEQDTVQIVDETSQYLLINTNNVEAGVLYIADTYYPGWVARVDGLPVQIHRANIGFRAVLLPAGARLVELIYAPLSFRFGEIISVASLMVFGVLLVISVVRGRR
jgi:hypothetical protein